VFLLLGMLYETVIHIPWELYFIFVIEERHGFNKQTLGLYIKDKVKGLILSIVFGAPAVSGTFTNEFQI
jgi:STE24 endopeptidase